MEGTQGRRTTTLVHRCGEREPDAAPRVDVIRELVRMNSLDILPQPFRMLLAPGGQPQQVWADATVDVAAKPRDGGGAVSARGSGIVTWTFARPFDRP